MAQNIPIHLDTSSNFRETVDLDGTVYTIAIKWNVRNDTGYLDIIENISGGGALYGIKIVPNWPLLRQIKSGMLIEGDLIVVKEDASLGSEIEYTTLGNGYNLYYVTQAELLVWEEHYGSR